MAPLNIHIKDVVFVTPSKATPSSILSLSTLDNIPDHNSLCQTIHVYKSSQNHGAYTNDQIDPNPINVIKEALSKALFYYYPLAGRLVKHVDGKFRVHCNPNIGVPFVEAIANCNLSSLHYLDGSDTQVAKLFAFDLPSQDEESVKQYPLGFKVTKFLCGGFVLGMAVSHVVIDGCGASQFLRAIIEFASGRNEASVKPVWERERLIGSFTNTPLPSPMDGPSVASSPYLPSKTLVHECFKVDDENIRRLKMSLIKEFDNNIIETTKENIIITSFESLAAYVWRSRVRALKLSYDGKTMLSVIVGIRRHLLDPPLPEGYYGNAIVDANVVLKVKELNEKPLSQVVKHIKESKKVAFTKEYIRNSINTFESTAEDFDVEGSGAFMSLTDWKHLGFLEKLDFRGNVLVNALPAPCNMFGSVGLCIFAPLSNIDSSMKGGVRVFVSLPIMPCPSLGRRWKHLGLLININHRMVIITIIICIRR